MKRKKHKYYSLDNQVNRVIDFLKSHEWAGPLALPLNLHNDLEHYTERYLFDSYIDLNYAYQYYKNGNYDEAKKRLGYSLMWKDEALDCSFIAGINDFTTLLFNKTEKYFNDIIQEIWSDETVTKQNQIIEFEDFKISLKKSIATA